MKITMKSETFVKHTTNHIVMGLLYKSEHLSCAQYDNSENPGIEVVKIVKGKREKLSVATNEIIFVVEGRIRLCFRELPSYEGVKGQVLFIPASADYVYEAPTDTTLVIFRLTQHVMLCSNYSIEKLYGIKPRVPQADREEALADKNKIGTLEINSRLWSFLDWIMDCVGDGLKCRCWFELKIKEFLVILRAYYPKEELHGFFYLILSGDTAFSEYVRLHWQRFRSVGEIADSLHMTHKQFSQRFTAVFKQTPYRWMMERKAEIVYRDVASTNKSFKEIALERGFNSDTQFTRFCKMHFGKTPTQLRETAEAIGSELK